MKIRKDQLLKEVEAITDKFQLMNNIYAEIGSEDGAKENLTRWLKMHKIWADVINNQVDRELISNVQFYYMIARQELEDLNERLVYIHQWQECFRYMTSEEIEQKRKDIKRMGRAVNDHQRELENVNYI